ncbi:hypothetical protein ACOSQ2_009506 [Xanthoceras sorbifolium]
MVRHQYRIQTSQYLMHQLLSGGNDAGWFMPPRRLKSEEISQIVDDFRIAVRNAIETVEATRKEIGANKVGIRLSPFADYNESGDSNSGALVLHMSESINKYKILFCHLFEPKMILANTKFECPQSLLSERKAFNGTFIVNGGYGREDGIRVVAEGCADLVAYGRLFLANSDLPRRFELDASLNAYNKTTFYIHDPVIAVITL